jgi:hypothetical protein
LCAAPDANKAIAKLIIILKTFFIDIASCGFSLLLSANKTGYIRFANLNSLKNNHELVINLILYAGLWQSL